MELVRIGLAVALLGGGAWAQEAPKLKESKECKCSCHSSHASSSSSVSSSRDENGEKSSRSAKLVIKDGIVVERSGDRELLERLDRLGKELGGAAKPLPPKPRPARVSTRGI